ncbi:hypothetical protein [Natronobiforma cellulositropha]|uniref:hypothetical protein n=1 Tax=Natronobiforma cellulositropha TaxID=1679076 RepID=UPI0021D5AD54|nr:hypothetical protein [Natronobiforma cellulositropha]
MKRTRRNLLRNVSALTASVVGASAAAAARPGAGEETPESVTSARIETTSRECGSEDWSRSSIDDGVVEIQGQVAASFPCHDAVFRSIAQRGSTLYVTIGLEAHSTPCIMCLGTVGYKAAIGLSDDSSVTDVVVRHEGSGGSQPIGRPRR